jgi:hypothetical protein
MGISEKLRVHFVGISGRVVLLLFAAALPGWICHAGSTILFDFEDGTQGWENESARPVPAQISTIQARHGRQSVAFTHSFSKSFGCLQCRVKKGFPMDISTNSFRGFSAWVYIPKGKPNWDVKMFVRYGENWAWAEGAMKRGLEPGWQKVDIGYERIPDLSAIQDMGIQVFNFREPIEATICIDQVEMTTQDTAPASASP